jgi:uncharacterized protein YjiS (DUF1127 family)
MMTDALRSTSASLRQPSRTTDAMGLLAAAREFVRRLRRAAEERQQLWRMSDHDLHDIGISRIDAIREAGKPLWRWP